MNTPEDVTTHPDPLISVVIATYNYGHLICRAIDSVLNQSVKNFEIIIIDDGSTDSTEATVKTYADSVRYVRQKNQGQSTAYNRGADLARGKFVLILDADDELLPDCLLNFETAIKNNSNFKEESLYYGGYISVSENGTEKLKPSSASPNCATARLKKFLERKITGLQHGSTLTPTQFFSRIRYPEKLRNNTDIVFFGQALANYPAHQVNQYMCKIHAHPQRVRQQLNKILITGLAPVDSLFNPEVIPASLMHLKRLYCARRHRSMARLLYMNGQYPKARHHYFMALKTYPLAMMEISSIGKAISSMWKSLPILARRDSL